MRKIKTQDVADALGWEPQYLRHAVEIGKVDFGICTSGGKSKRKTYRYFPEKLRPYIGDKIVDEWLKEES